MVHAARRLPARPLPALLPWRHGNGVLRTRPRPLRALARHRLPRLLPRGPAHLRDPPAQDRQLALPDGRLRLRGPRRKVALRQSARSPPGAAGVAGEVREENVAHVGPAARRAGQHREGRPPEAGVRTPSAFSEKFKNENSFNLEQPLAATDDLYGFVSLCVLISG